MARGPVWKGGVCTEGAILSLSADYPASFSNSKVKQKQWYRLQVT